MDFQQFSIVRMMESPDMDGNMRFDGYQDVAGPFGDESAAYVAGCAVPDADRWDMFVRCESGKPNEYGMRDVEYEHLEDMIERHEAMAENAVL